MEAFRYYNKNDYNNLLCIGTDRLETNNFPNMIKEFILEGLKCEERVIVFTDNIFYKDIENIFSNDCEFIREKINSSILKIKTYDSLEFSFAYKEFNNIIEILSVVKGKLRIFWDFKNIVKRPHMLNEVMKCVDKIILNSNIENIKNAVYIDNNRYDEKLLEEFGGKFDYIGIVDRSLEMFLKDKESIHNTLWLIQSNAQLKHQNNNLVLFNDVLSSIPKSADEEEFKRIIINKVRDICDVDFCILYNPPKNKSNTISLDSYYGLTKKHKYYLVNDKELNGYRNKINEELITKGINYYIDIDKVDDISLREKLRAIDIVSCLGMEVEYYDINKGVIWIGRYKNNTKISKLHVEHMQSICRTAYYLIQEQKKFKEMQNRLIENEKLRATGEMAAGIAHDINNILTPILGSIEVLKEKISDRSILRQLNVIEMCAYDGINISNKVKQLNKSFNNENELTVFNIDNLLEDAIELTREKWLTETASKGVKINIVRYLESKGIVKGNMTELREVFINIIRNAVDAMNYGGEIGISTEKISDYIVIEIRDNGIGMNEEITKRVFEPFFTTKGRNGSGLGLSVSYKIIQSHNGSIHIESEENVGTSFIIKLPICNESVENIHKDIKEKEIDFSGNILVIDDQEEVRNIVSQIIKSMTRWRVKSCSNESIEKELKRRNYNIVLCDFSMPNIDGLQIAKKVKRINKNTYFCLMTGWVGNFNEEKMNNVDYVLEKPINKEYLRHMFLDYGKKYNK